MSFSLLPDAMWAEIQPLLPVESSKPKGGRPPVPARQALIGIIFILRTGMAWNFLPREMGCGSGTTCWRRFQEWTALGVWPEVHKRLLNALGKQEEVDLSRAIIDSQSVRAVLGGTIPVRTPRTERKTAASAI